MLTHKVKYSGDIFVFVNDVPAPSKVLVSELYDNFKDEDGLLYMVVYG